MLWLLNFLGVFNISSVRFSRSVTTNHFILCRPLLLLPSIFPSIRVFSNESVLLNRWPEYWSFSFSISPCNEHPGPISFRRDWLDLLAVQGTLKSLLQHHRSLRLSKTPPAALCQWWLFQPLLHRYISKEDPREERLAAGRGTPGGGMAWRSPASRAGQVRDILIGFPSLIAHFASNCS